MRSIRVACVLVLWFMMMAGCAPRLTPSESEPTIVVVSSLPLTGSARLQTEMMEAAIRMAFEEVHYRLGPYRLEYRSWDDATAQAGGWDPAKEKENASRAAADPDVMAYIGTYNSGAAKIAIPILNQADLVMVSPGNTYTGLTKPLGEAGEPEIYYPTGTRTYCRVVPADDLQGTAGAVWAHSLGVRSVYILDDKELYGRGIATVFEAHCRRLGIRVLAHEGIDGKAADFRSVASKVQASGAELLYYGGTIQNGAAKLIKDLRSSGAKARFMGPDSLKDSAFLEAAGPAAEGVLCTLGSLPAEQLSPAGQAWYRAYQQRFGVEPEAFAIYAYESARVVLDGLARAGVKDRRAVRQAVMQTRDFPGLLGRWSFDESGDTSLSTMSGFEVTQGQFHFRDRLEVEGSPGVEGVSLSQAGSSLLGSPETETAARPRLTQQLLTGLSNGALIAIIALGYTLVYGIAEMVNFAHGEVFMIGALGALTGIEVLGLQATTPPLVLALGLLAVLGACMLACGLLNWGLDRSVYRRLRRRSPQTAMIAAMGISFILLNVGGYWKGWGPLHVPRLLPEGNLLGAESGLVVTWPQVGVLVCTLPLLAGLTALVYATRWGQAMRAVAQNPEAASLMGIPPDRTISWAFFLGGGLAGAAGVLYALYHQEVFFQIGFRQGLQAFTAAVLGGIGSLPGAVLGGLLIGLVEALTAHYWGQALAPAAVFGVLIGVILVRPTGLLGSGQSDKV